MGSIGSEIRSLRDPPRNGSGRQTVWFRGYGTPCEADVKELNSKIYSAFEGVKSFPFKPIILQFWRPIDDDRRLLGSSDNPFTSLAFYRPLQGKYRPRSMSYHYYAVQGEEDNNNHSDWIVSGGPVVTAFLNRLPEVVLDLRALRGSPLVDCALECGLTSCVALPVFRPGGSDCAAGVIECTVKHASLLLPLFVELKRELDRVGLGIYHLQGSWPYKTVSGDLEPAKLEIEKALEMACESHGLTLGQVWISCETENDRRMFLVKLSRYFTVSSDDGDPLKDFYDRHDVVPGEGLAGKALQTHQLYLCRNIYNNNNNKGVLALLSANSNTQCASFVICLRSMHTGDLDYALEFFWPCGRNHVMLLEPLLLTLNKALPSFKLASGQHLGDELDVIDVETMTSVAGQSDLNQYSNPEDDDDDLALLTTYRNETRLLYLPCSSTYENVMEKLNKEFELDRAQTYKVEYEVFPGQWSRLVCLETCRRIGDMGVIKLRLLANRREVGWRWRTNNS